MGSPRIRAVGTAVPERSFGQEALLAIFGYDDPVRRSFFLRSGIERRHFFVDATQPRLDEDVDQLAAVPLRAVAAEADLEAEGTGERGN